MAYCLQISLLALCTETGVEGCSSGLVGVWVGERCGGLWEERDHSFFEECAKLLPRFECVCLTSRALSTGFIHSCQSLRV